MKKLQDFFRNENKINNEVHSQYQEVSEALEHEGSDDYFYDDYCFYLSELMSQFTAQDWQKVRAELSTKEDQYKIRLAYCIDQDLGMDGFQILLSLLDEESDEVVEYALDSLDLLRTKNTGNSCWQIRQLCKPPSDYW